MPKAVRTCILFIAVLAAHLPACLAAPPFPFEGTTYEITFADGSVDVVQFLQKGSQANWYFVKRSEAFYQARVQEFNKHNPTKSGEPPRLTMPDLRPFWLNIDQLGQAREWTADKTKPDAAQSPKN